MTPSVTQLVKEAHGLPVRSVAAQEAPSMRFEEGECGAWPFSSRQPSLEEALDALDGVVNGASACRWGLVIFGIRREVVV